MILKLLKYDLKKILGFLVYFYVISLGLSIITRLIKIGDSIQFIYIIGQVFAGITYASIAQILVNIITQSLKNFTNDFYKDESYLTHTLPVTKNQLLISKYLTTLIVVVISVAVCVLDLAIVLYTPELFEGIKTLIALTVQGFNMNGGVFILLLILLIFVQASAMLSMAYTAIIKANMGNSQKMLFGFIWFFVFYFVSGAITLISAIIVCAIGGNLTALFAEVIPQNVFVTILITALICNFIYAVGFYYISNYLFNKGVNVD